jgi:hypothetical protein
MSLPPLILIIQTKSPCRIGQGLVFQITLANAEPYPRCRGVIIIGLVRMLAFTCAMILAKKPGQSNNLDKQSGANRVHVAAPLAQLAEQLTLNQRVAGSSPAWRIGSNIALPLNRLFTAKSALFHSCFPATDVIFVLRSVSALLARICATARNWKNANPCPACQGMSNFRRPYPRIRDGRYRRRYNSANRHL